MPKFKERQLGIHKVIRGMQWPDTFRSTSHRACVRTIHALLVYLTLKSIKTHEITVMGSGPDGTAAGSGLVMRILTAQPYFFAIKSTIGCKY